MGRPKGWMQQQTGRPPRYSPGRPPVWRREDLQAFWVAIAEGATSEDAAARAGVSPAVGTRWFREGGGMPTVRYTETVRESGVCTLLVASLDPLALGQFRLHL